MRLNCPECGSRTGTRTSRQISQTVTEGYMSCRACGCRFKVVAEIVGIVIHGEAYNPATALPQLKQALPKQ